MTKEPDEADAAALTHASFFSGIGGLDLGLERAGWTTVAFSEIEPYPVAVFRRHWPDAEPLGDINAVEYVPDATLWTSGAPCQDLSVAGKRRGLAGERSGLILTNLDLVREHRPRAFLYENVPGLLSSNAGRDFGTLIRLLVELRYGVAWRILDAVHFGVPQRRRRVYLLALDLERHPAPDSAATVLAVGTRCSRDHTQEREAWADAAPGAGRGATALVHGTLSVGGHVGIQPNGQDAYIGHLVVDGAPPDADGNGAAPGLPRRPHDRAGVEDEEPLPWAPRLDELGIDFSLYDRRQGTSAEADLGLDPDGLDSHRYRATGNAVAVPVAEYIGMRLRRYLEGEL